MGIEELIILYSVGGIIIILMLGIPLKFILITKRLFMSLGRIGQNSFNLLNIKKGKKHFF